MPSFCCSSFMRRVCFCSGLSFSACFNRSNLYWRQFISDSSRRCFLSPRCGTKNTASLRCHSISKGTTISFASLLNLSRISGMAVMSSSSSVSSSLRLYSNVKLWFTAPLRTCMKLMKACERVSSSAMVNTSMSVIVWLTTSLLEQ